MIPTPLFKQTLHEIRVASGSSATKIKVARSAKNGLWPASGFATEEKIDKGKYLIHVDGVVYGRGVVPITYEHPAGVINTIGQTSRFQVARSKAGLPALAWWGGFYPKLQWAKEVIAVAEAMEEAGGDLSLYVSMEGVSTESRVTRHPTHLEIHEMELKSLAVTIVPQNDGAAWRLGDDWVPVAASLLSRYGDSTFVQALKIFASGVGYPTQGMASTTYPGSELGPLIGQSLDAGGGRKPPSEYTLRLLKDYPQLTPEQGETMTRTLIALLEKRRAS